MTFNLTILKKTDDEVVRTVVHNGIELSLVVKKDDAFTSAFAEVQSLMNAKNKVSKDSLKRANNGIGANEALLFVIGEYCIKSWNVVVDDVPLAINGDNFLLVLDNAFTQDELIDFITKLLTQFGEAVAEFGQKADELKKKSSKNTAGKK